MYYFNGREIRKKEKVDCTYYHSKICTKQQWEEAGLTPLRKSTGRDRTAADIIEKQILSLDSRPVKRAPLWFLQWYCKRTMKNANRTGFVNEA